jgi:DNA-directed RNA polymerase II subunit RPB2
MDIGIRGDEARALSEHILKTYFTTRDYPYTCHHIDSYDQFLSDDLPAIIRAKNPLLTLQDQIGKTGVYAYKAEVFVGGLEGKQIYIGTPSVALRDSKEGRLLFPNEARLRNLTYAATVQADIVIRVTLSSPNPSGGEPISQEITLDPVADPANYGYLGKFPLFRVPIMLHSRYCLLNGKPQEFLKEVGECQYDFGGYFIVDGSEKVLITHQQQAFNTLRIRKQPRDPKIALFSSIACLNPRTREVRKINFLLKRRENTLALTLPFVRKEVPIFVIFRALGIQSDYDILRLIFPDPESAEAKMLEPMLHESMLEAFPFYDTFSALQYIKVLTKGFSEAHVLHILYNQTFIHVENRPRARATFLAECVRRILRVAAGLDTETDQDDTRNQRCITSGVLIRSLFQDIYDGWTKKTLRNLDEEYKYHPSTYSGTNFVNLFLQGTLNEMFNEGLIRENIMRAFKGKWSAGSGSAVGEEKSGVIQALSRLSYLDFLSHCRRAVLDFDTGMKLPSPRRLHTSQYGYFCTSETPGGASIGITKNLSMLTSISTATDPSSFIEWLFERGGVVPCEKMTPKTVAISVPVFVNAGIVGYTYRPLALRDALKTLKWVGALPATSSVGFSMRDRRIFVYMDEGRPMRPLIHLGRGGKLPAEALKRATSWRDLVMGVLPVTKGRSVAQSGFIDPLAREEAPTLEDYVTKLMPSTGVIEYVDPYEMNEAYVANFPEHIQSETSHMEIHPSTIVGLLTSMIPFANHNQSPRNQLSCSQSKQGISIYSTAYPTRYDNQTHVLCYPQAPIARTIYYDYLADGKMGYGANLILAMGCFTGYNQDDGIVMNADTIERGMFRSTSYRGYEAFEEDDPLTRTKTRIANPVSVSSWTSLKPGLDYTKLDERGIIRPGEIVDETTVLVGRYLQSVNGDMKDASLTAQVWTRGRVEQVSVTKSNQGMAMVKVRVVQERLPELGDKFCLTSDHEVLTKEMGWLPIDKVQTSHTVAQLNRVSGKLEYVTPKEIFEFDHTGDMYEVKSQGVNLCTTLNHRMWIQERNSKEYTLKEAKDMMGRRVRFSSHSPSSAPAFQLVVGQNTLKDEKMNAFISLFGIWIAEGWVYKNEDHHLYRIEICANKPRVKSALDSISKILDLQTSYNEKSKKYYINTKEYVEFFEPFSVGAINKRLPAWCFELSQEQSKLLLEALCLGDGHETKTSLSYSTSSKQLRDDLQIVVQHAGYTSGFFKHVEEGSTRVDSSGRVYKANADNWHIQIRRKRVYPTLNHGHAHTQGGQSEEIIQYSGKVYCISVPSEVFLVRRAGTIVWTGNSNRHGQKGTIGMLIRGYDMPRRRDGIPVDMIMNTHAMPSRMTVAQLLEALVGKAAPALGATANCTLFMNEGSPAEAIGAVLRDQLGMEPLGEELLYDGMSGCFIPSKIFVGSVYTMRLKHMPEDKWNARAEGRREQRTHQPTGGRGAQGGLRIGEMERDAILGHGVASFMRESLMKRADGYSTWICDGCGTIPIYNESENKFVCSMCDGPVKYIGESATNLELLPPSKRSIVGFSKVEIPYAFKLLDQELNTYLNMGLRVLTEKGVKKLRPAPLKELTDEQQRVALTAPLPERILPETTVPELIQQQEELSAREEDLDALGAATAEAVAAQARSEAEAEAAAEEAQRTAMAASAVPVPGAPAPQTLGALGPAPANGLPTVVLQPAAPAAPPRSIVMGETLEGGLEAQQLPDLGGIPTQAPAASPYPVNVQAASQPVLVMPVNVAQPVAAAPTGEYYPPAAPGAPGVFAVDTSPQAMASAGFSSGSPGAQRGGARASSPGGSGAPRLNITKAGGSGADSAAMSNPNVRITVNKMG